ncbi:MAG: hypothetical protein AAGF44_12140 [Pseudomonadota bacterium]
MKTTWETEDATAEAALTLWTLPEDAICHLINLSESRTYLVEIPGWHSILGLHMAGC